MYKALGKKKLSVTAKHGQIQMVVGGGGGGGSGLPPPT